MRNRTRADVTARMIRPLLPILLTGLLLAGCDVLATEPDVDAPSSILGWKLVETISTVDILSGSPGTLRPGQTLTYYFVDRNTILGDGLTTLETQSWSYRLTSSNVAVVELEYGPGGSQHELTFETETSGSFDDQHFFHRSGSRVRYTGTFRIQEITEPACELQQIGSLTFWVSNSSAVQRVDLTVEGLGTRSATQYFTSAPSCDGTESGLMRFTDVRAGSYTFNARDQGNTTWGPSSVQVNACRCTLLELR